VHERVLTKSFVVLIIGNSKSFHLGAQGTFKVKCIGILFYVICIVEWAWRRKERALALETQQVRESYKYRNMYICMYVFMYTYMYVYM